MPSRTLDFPIFDADNHMYETREALTKFLPEKYEKAIQYVEVDGRTKIVVRGQISEYIPNPTFDVVAAPGAQEEYYRSGNPEGKSYRELVQVVIHALNEWMYETWTFDYEDRIFATPVITLGIVEDALAELEWVLERSVRCILVRPGPVAGLRGTRSPGLPEFDPVWKRVQEAGILVGMHASDSGYAEIANWWEDTSEFLPFKPSPFRMIVQGKRPIEDTMTAMVVHGALSRFPDLKVACVENGANWVPHLLQSFNDVYEKQPHDFIEDP